MSDKVTAWHFIPNDSMIKRLNVRAEVGLVLEHKGPMTIRKAGLHGSIKPIDALEYAPGSILCKVEIWGDVQKQDDKVCGRFRKIIGMHDICNLLHTFACEVAEQALKRHNIKDERSCKAIQVKRLWLEGKATDQELRSAREQAWQAYYDVDAAAADRAAAAAADADAAAVVAAAYAAAAYAAAAYAAAAYAAAAAAAAATDAVVAAATAAAAAKKAERERQNILLETLLNEVFN